MTHAAKKLLRTAAARGWTFLVTSCGTVDYRGPSAKDAWAAVEATEEATVHFIAPTGKRAGSAFMIDSAEPDETVADCTASSAPEGREFETMAATAVI
jgi:hypothetical protein